MAIVRKPIPGKDEGQWGEILNDFLDVVHKSDGTLRDGVVGEDNLSAGVRSKLGGSGTTLSALTDVDTAGATTGQVLALQSNGSWTASNIPWSGLTDTPTPIGAISDTDVIAAGEDQATARGAIGAFGQGDMVINVKTSPYNAVGNGVTG